MSKNVTLDRGAFEKITEKIKLSLRAHHVLAVAAILLISFGVGMFFLSAPIAEADAPSPSMNVLQMHIDHPNRNSLVPEKINDMSLVFSAPD